MLKEKSFFGTNKEDPIQHKEDVKEIVDQFNVPRVDKDDLIL